MTRRSVQAVLVKPSPDRFGSHALRLAILKQTADSVRPISPARSWILGVAVVPVLPGKGRTQVENERHEGLFDVTSSCGTSLLLSPASRIPGGGPLLRRDDERGRQRQDARVPLDVMFDVSATGSGGRVSIPFGKADCTVFRKVTSTEDTIHEFAPALRTEGQARAFRVALQTLGTSAGSA